MSTEAKLCRGCGAPIVWAKTLAGRFIPLDATPVAEKPADKRYSLVNQDGADGPTAVPVFAQYVSHFTTCPKAAEFSGKGKAATS